MKKLTDNPHFWACITIIFWIPTYVFTRLLGDTFSAAGLGFFRYLTASIFLGIFILIRKTPLPEKRDLPWFFIAALCGFSLYMILFNLAAPHVTSATGSVIIALSPLFTAILAAVILREKLSRKQWICLGVEIIGLVIMTAVGNEISFNRWILLLLICPFMFGFYNLIQRKMSQRYTSFQTSVFSILFGAVELVWAAPAAFREAAAAPPLKIFYALYLGIFTSALGYVTWTKAISKARNTSEISNYSFLLPIFSPLLGFLMNNEVPSVTVLIGGAVILIGAYEFNRKTE